MNCISYHDCFETLVVSKSGESAMSKESGDCILLDFRNCFFAVADSSPRDKSMSRKLLRQTGALLDELLLPGGGVGNDDSELLRQHLKSGMEGILDQQYGQGSCTFTGVLLVERGEDMKIILLHTGDSSLLMYDTQTASSKILTRSNFWLAGKSRSLYQTEVLEIPGGSWLLLATDGMIDVINTEFGGTEEFFRCRIASGMGDDFFKSLMARSHDGGLYDDAGMILFRPEKIEPHGEKIFLGGVPEKNGKEPNIMRILAIPGIMTAGS